MAGKQFELFSIPNPCIGVCQSNRKGYCLGCLRSREERFNWHLKSEQEQRRIIQLLGKRKSRLLQQQSADKQSVEVQNAANPAQPSLFAASTSKHDKNSGHQ